MNEPRTKDNRSLWRRLAMSPLRDLVRSLSDSRSAAKQLHHKGTIALDVESLPEKLPLLVNDVVRRTRLRRHEKLDVSRELYDHFSDGLAAGKTAEELANSFGDVAQAARLIRRAKIRSRSWRHQVLTFGMRAALTTSAAAFLVWGFLAIRYFSGRPKISRNYLAAMDQEFASIPMDDRAWPLYRQALMELSASAFSDGHPWESAEDLSDQARQIVREHQGPIRMLREAASRRRFGFSYQDPTNREWLSTAVKLAPEKIAEFQNTEGPVVEVVMPQIHDARRLGYLLVADAWVAAERQDALTVTEDVVALLALADHVRDSHSFLVTDLTSLAFFDLAVQLTNRLLEQLPDLLTDEQLQRITSRFNHYMGGGRLNCRWDGERMTFADAVQRMYSDNGKGDGLLTKQGLELLLQYSGSSGPAESSPATAFLDAVVNPWRTSLAVGRRELELLADKMYEFMEAESQKPRWLRKSLDEQPEFAQVLNAGPNSLRWSLLALFAPSLEGMSTALDIATQKRDAIVTVIALHRFHRQHGAWPNSLAELVPDFLSKVPLDQFDGSPLRYRLEHGKPLLYSIGMNTIDDQGRRPKKRFDEPHASDGDWILWPSIRKSRSTEEAN